MIKQRKFIDIGANLTDLMYTGVYNGSKKHQPDLCKVVERSIQNGLDKIFITSGCIDDFNKSINLIETYSDKKNFFYTTIGVHPTRCLEFTNQEDDGESYLNKLEELYLKFKDRIVAFGELGLDYDRLFFCPKDIQLKYFEKQLELVKKIKLPMFLHSRNAEEDFMKILRRHNHELFGGVVHSFDGSLENAMDYIELGYLIGLNGCSLRKDESLEVAAKLPLNKILIETDSPWCEIKQSHPGFKHLKTIFPTKKKEKHDEQFMVKGRNEPSNIVQIFEILCSIRQESAEEIEKKIYENTINLFFSNRN